MVKVMKKKKSNQLLDKCDLTIATVLAKRNIGATLRFESSYSPGDSIDIAYSVMTPGGPFYRVKGTSRWLSNEDVELNNQEVPFTDYRFKDSTSSAILYKNKESRSSSKEDKRSTTNKPHFNKKTVTKNMDKQQIRNIVSSVQPGDNISFNFAGSKSDSSGLCKVLKVRPGRGKGGSLLVDLQAADGSTFTTGTPDSEVIVNITTPDGVVHGLSSETEIRTYHEVDISRAVALKEQFKTLQARTSGDTVIDVESSEASLSGKFKIVGSRQLRGRFGQIVLDLESLESGEAQSLWSYRHSGVITRISVL
jgi:hypothetical protein